MKNLLSFSFLFFLILSLVLFFSRSVLASPLEWNTAFLSPRETTFVKVSDSNTNVVYASIRYPDGFELLKSTNFGLSWASIKGNLTGGDVNWISTPSIDQSVVAISLWDNGVFLSDNGGTSWQKIFNSPNPRSVAINPTDDSIIYVGIGGSNAGPSGVYKSIDRGNSWFKQVALGNRNNAQITIDKFNTSRIFADADPYFFRTIDDGLNWELLPLDHAYTHGTIIDKDDHRILYTGRFDVNEGVYKSEDDGGSWVWKNSGPIGKIFQIAQDSDGSLYASRVNSGGGIWRSQDGAETWENVGDPAWGARNTWGLDAKEGRVFVSVEGLGLFYADASPSAYKDPVVFLPGFGGSWSRKAIILGQETTPSDWQMIPGFTEVYYEPLLATLRNAGHRDGGDLFTFPYDYRQSIATTAAQLNIFLDEVFTGDPGKKINLVGHSMGGMTSHYCVSKIPGCKEKVQRVITGGSPHQGTVDAYKFWEGGLIEEKRLDLKFSQRLLLAYLSRGLMAPHLTVQTNLPGVKDLLPIFDYLENKLYADMSVLGRNPVLESIFPPSSDFQQAAIPLVGNRTATPSFLETDPPNAADLKLNRWLDGRPTKTLTGNGDNTSLLTSAQVFGADNRYYDIAHQNYFRNATVLADILAILGLSGTIGPIPPEPRTLLGFFLHSPARLTVYDQNHQPIGTSADNGETVFLVDPPPTLVLSLTGTANGDYQLDYLLATDAMAPQTQTIAGTIATNQVVNLDFVVDESFTGYSDPSGGTYQETFNRLINQISLRRTSRIENRVNDWVTAINSGRDSNGAFTQLQNNYLALFRLLKSEPDPITRDLLFDAADSLLSLYLVLAHQHGVTTTLDRASQSIQLGNRELSRVSNSTNLSDLQLENIVLAEGQISLAGNYLKNDNLRSLLLAESVAILL